MALVNVTFTGNIFNTSGSQYSGTEVKYQLYFYKINSGSSSSIWGSTRLSEYGQYNVNLGDSDILTPEGVANVGDKVIICFWTPNTSIRSDDNLTEWGFTETTLTSASDYIADVQLKGGLTPVCDYTITGSTSISHDVIATDVGSHDRHTWTYGSTTMYQEPSRYSQPLFYTMNTLQPSSSDINWDDSWSYNLNPASVYTHSYSTPAIYDITTYVTNTSGLSASQLFMWTIYYGTPVIGFNIDNPTPNPIGITGVGELVTFTNSTTNPDGRAIPDGWTCDWTIEDGSHSITYTGQSFTFSPTHSFHSIGNHNVTLTLHWYNGFAWVSSTITHVVNQLAWSVGNGLTWLTPVYVNTEITFTPAITGNTNYVTNVDYIIGGYDVIAGLGYNEPFIYTFIISDSHTLKQTIYYHTGFEAAVIEHTYTVIMSPLADYAVTDDDCGLIYTSNSSPGKQPIVMYKWSVTLNSTIIASLEGQYATTFRYNWPTTGRFHIALEITDALNQTANVSKMYTINSCRGGGGTSKRSGGDGGWGPPRIVYKEKPLPRVTVRLKRPTKDPKIIVEVKLVE